MRLWALVGSGVPEDGPAIHARMMTALIGLTGLSDTSFGKELQ